jgi:hypothetical protein
MDSVLSPQPQLRCDSPRRGPVSGFRESIPTGYFQRRAIGRFAGGENSKASEAQDARFGDGLISVAVRDLLLKSRETHVRGVEDRPEQIAKSGDFGAGDELPGVRIEIPVHGRPPCVDRSKTCNALLRLLNPRKLASDKKGTSAELLL